MVRHFLLGIGLLSLIAVPLLPFKEVSPPIAKAAGEVCATVNPGWDFAYLLRQLGLTPRPDVSRLAGTTWCVRGVTQTALDAAIAAYTPALAAASQLALRRDAIDHFRGITVEDLARALVRAGAVSSGTLVTQLRAMRGL